MKRLPSLAVFWFVAIPIIAFLGFVYFQARSSYDGDYHGLFGTYPGLLVAMASGLFGASFSMLTQSRKRAAEGSLEDVSAAANWRTLGVRASVGLGAAAILYFFFRSGLLEGNLWPDLSLLGFEPLNTTGNAIVPNEHWCLLIIWCFIAGFSETFVPNILQKTEKKAETT